MESDIKLLGSQLNKHGFSCTNARKQVLKTLLGNGPLSMSQIVSQSADIDRASVYRTISLFESLGIINRITIGWKYKIELSDMFSHHHHHIICKKCGTIKDLAHSQKIEKLINVISHEQNYTPISHQLEIIGFCRNCQD